MGQVGVQGIFVKIFQLRSGDRLINRQKWCGWDHWVQKCSLEIEAVVWVDGMHVESCLLEVRVMRYRR